MIAPAKSTPPAFPSAKIRRIVQGVLPKGETFRLQTEDSGIERKRIVRVVTPAWRSLGNPERISRVLKAMQSQLSPEEQGRIFRLSVLTEEQFREIVLENFNPRSARPPQAEKKRKPAEKTKQAFPC